MIKGKFLGKEFTFEDETGFTCSDPDVLNKLEMIYSAATFDLGPEDGFPEFYFLDELKRFKNDFELIEFKEPEYHPDRIY